MGLIQIIESAYDLEADDDKWLDTLCRSVAPELDSGLGTVAYAYTVDEERKARALTIKQFGTAFDVTDEVRNSLAALPPAWTETALMVPGFIGSGIEVMPDDMQSRMSENLRSADLPPDSMAIAAANRGGRGLVLCGAMAEPRRSTRSERARWYRIAAHVRAGMRLRGYLADLEGASPPERPLEAVIEPGGKVVHAEADARTALARAQLRQRAIAIDTARSRAGRSDPSAALEIWRGLVLGTWTLVENFDTDGRRYYIARRNEPLALDPRGLTDREFQVVNLASSGAANKHIAYELGLATTTVSTHLRRAMQKLNVRNRVELRQRIASTWLAELEGSTHE